MIFLPECGKALNANGFYCGRRARAAYAAGRDAHQRGGAAVWVSSESQRQLLAGIVRSNSRAARLVNQLLLMMHSEARIDTAMEPVPLTSLIQERMAALEPLASGRKIELEFFAEDEIWIAGVRSV